MFAVSALDGNPKGQDYVLVDPMAGEKAILWGIMITYSLMVNDAGG